MAVAPTGEQYAIRPWEAGLELLAYLATQGVGTYVPGRVTGNTLFLEAMPSTPVVSASLVIDASPAPRAGVSRQHYTLYIRDTHIATSGARAAIAFESLHMKSLPLPSYWLWSECDGLPSSHRSNANEIPVHVLGISTAGVVKRG